MVKDIWHKIENGSFEKRGKTYDYVIEQNKNTPLENGGVRLRVIKSYPKVDAIRTRYEPHIEVDGEEEAYISSYFGYDMKRLLNLKTIVIINTIMIIAILMFFGINVVDKITSFLPEINSPIWISNIVGLLIQVLVVFLMLFVILIPTNVRLYEKIKLYFKLKKEGLNYKEITPTKFTQNSL